MLLWMFHSSPCMQAIPTTHRYTGGVFLIQSDAPAVLSTISADDICADISQNVSIMQVLRFCHLWVHGRGIQAERQVPFPQHSANATRPPGILLSPEALHQGLHTAVSHISRGSNALHVVQPLHAGL